MRLPVIFHHESFCSLFLNWLFCSTKKTKEIGSQWHYLDLLYGWPTQRFSQAYEELTVLFLMVMNKLSLISSKLDLRKNCYVEYRRWHTLMHQRMRLF